MADTDIELKIGLDVSDALKTADNLEKEVKAIFESRKGGKQSAALTGIDIQLKQGVQTAKDLKQQIQSINEMKMRADRFKALPNEIKNSQAELARLRAMYDDVRQQVMNKPVSIFGEKYEGVEQSYADVLRDYQERYSSLTEEQRKVVEEHLQELQSVMSTYQFQLRLPDGTVATKSLADFNSFIKVLEQNVQDLTQEQLELGKSATVPTRDYQALQQELGAVGKQIKQTEKDLAAATEPSIKADYYIQLEQLQQSYSGITTKMKEMRDAGKAFTLPEPDMAKRAELEQSLDKTNDKLKQQIIHHQEIVGKEQQQANVLGSTRKAVTALRNTFSKLVSLGRRLLGVFRGIFKHTQNTTFSFRRLFQTLLRYGIGINSFMAIFRKFRSAVSEGFNNLAEDSDRFKESIQNLKSATLTLKNSLAAALQPLVSTALPYIENSIQYINTLLETFAKFSAAAVGQKYYYRAIKLTGDAAEKAKQQLSGLDNLNVLQDKQQMFEEVPIDDDTLQAFEEFKVLLKDTSELGKRFGKFVVGNLKKIDWQKIQDGINGVALEIDDLANGILEADDIGETFGQTIGELANTVTGFADTLVKNFNFERAGEEFGKSVQTFIDTYNWDALGETIGGFLRGAIDFAWSMATQIDVEELGNKLGSAVSKLLGELNRPDKFGVTGWKKLGKFIGFLLNLLLQTVKHIPWMDVVNGIVEALEAAWDEAPTELKTLALGVITIGTIKDVVFSSAAAKAISSALSPIIAAGIVLALIDIPLQEITEALTGNRTGVKDIFDKMLQNMGDSVYQLFHPDEYKDPKTGNWVKSGSTKLYKWKSDGQWHDTPEPASAYTKIPEGGVSSIAGGLTKQDTNKAVAIFEQTGEQLGGALSGGIGQGAKTAYAVEVRGTLNDTWKTIAEDARKAFREHSPSKVFAEIGEYIDLGLAQGITSEQLAVEKAMAGMLSKTGVNVPSIATGAVVPQSKAFASAMSGSGAANTLADTLQRVLSTVSGQGGINGTGTQEIVLNLDGREFMRAMVKQNGEYKKQHNGASAFA